jgi:hypothetical protein
MSHKLVSNQAVVYNAQTQASSVLTITPQSTAFNDNEGSPMGGGGNTHTVTVNGIVWANYGLIGQVQIDRVGFTIDSTTWDAFYTSASEAFQTTSSYDNVVETALEYIQTNLTPIYGLSAASWSVEM